MNSRVVVKLLVAVIVLSNNGILSGSDNPLIAERPTIKVEWHISNTHYHSQIAPKVQTINERQCTHFGLNKKDSWGFAKVDAFCSVTSDDKKEEVIEINLIKEPHQYLIEKKIQKTLGLKNQGKFLWNTKVKNKNFMSQAAKAYGVKEKDLEKAAVDCLHPQLIPAEWLVDKKIGDKIVISATGFDLEVTIAEISEDEDLHHLLNVLSWKNYTAKNAPKVVKLLLVCSLLGILGKYLKR